jgi:hypothetical protein
MSQRTFYLKFQYDSLYTAIEEPEKVYSQKKSKKLNLI